MGKAHFSIGFKLVAGLALAAACAAACGTSSAGGGAGAAAGANDSTNAQAGQPAAVGDGGDAQSSSSTGGSGAGAGDDSHLGGAAGAAGPPGPVCSQAGGACSCAVLPGATATSGDCSPTADQVCCAGADWPSSGSCDCGVSATAPADCIKTQDGCVCVAGFTPEGKAVSACAQPAGGRCCRNDDSCFCDASLAACPGDNDVKVKSCESLSRPVCPAEQVEVTSCATPTTVPPVTPVTVQGCFGVPDQCNELTTAKCASHPGCSVPSSCTGTPKACSASSISIGECASDGGGGCTPDQCSVRGCTLTDYSCTGYASSCGSYSAPTSACSDQLGCYNGLTPFCYGGYCDYLDECKGTVTACSSRFSSTDCARGDGCTWGRKCQGTPTSCATIPVDQCAYQSGCTVKVGTTCSGAAQACDAYTDKAACGAASGCAWGEHSK